MPYNNIPKYVLKYMYWKTIFNTVHQFHQTIFEFLNDRLNEER